MFPCSSQIVQYKRQCRCYSLLSHPWTWTKCDAKSISLFVFSVFKPGIPLDHKFFAIVLSGFIAVTLLSIKCGHSCLNVYMSFCFVLIWFSYLLYTGKILSICAAIYHDNSTDWIICKEQKFIVLCSWLRRPR